jgi:hypothetical protein
VINSGRRTSARSKAAGPGSADCGPRSGRSPWPALYRRLGDGLVVLAIGPEAQHDKRGFDRAVRLAEDRLKEIEGWHGG